MITERRKYHIILVEDVQENEARKISIKLPTNVKNCNGFLFSGNVAGLAAKNYMLGNVSLFVNNRKSHVLHYTIHSKPLVLQKRKNELLKLNECIEGGSLVQGYYVDLGTAESYPYKVRIYLDCTITNG